MIQGFRLNRPDATGALPVSASSQERGGIMEVSWRCVPKYGTIDRTMNVIGNWPDPM
jgi:hypothetical protein